MRLYLPLLASLLLSCHSTDHRPESTLVLMLAATPPVALRCVYVPGGYYPDLGTQLDPGQRRTYLPAYFIGETEVSVGQFKAFIQDSGYRTTAERKGCFISALNVENPFTYGATWKNPWTRPVRDEDPVVGVSWLDAKAFCEWLSKRSGYEISIPTEIQWEKAARGSANYVYPWGNRPLPDRRHELALFVPRSEAIRSLRIVHREVPPYAFTQSVSSSEMDVSVYGCLHMLDNVKELCEDEYAEAGEMRQMGRNSADPCYNSRLPPECVVRGACWATSVDEADLTIRSGVYKNYAQNNVGFRIVLLKKHQ